MTTLATKPDPAFPGRLPLRGGAPRLAGVLLAAGLLLAALPARAEEAADGARHAVAAAGSREEAPAGREAGNGAAAPDGGTDILETDEALPGAREGPAARDAEAGHRKTPGGSAADGAAAGGTGDKEGAGTAGEKDAADGGAKDPFAGLDGEEREKARLWPSVDSLVTAPFGEARPYYRLLDDAPKRMRRHSGMDIRAHLGWPVRALRGGKVVRQGPRGAAGITVEILQDDGRTALYAHLRETLVKAGQEVSRGERIGLVGCSGRTTGAHLHLGMKEKGAFIDPRGQVTGLWELFDPPVEDLRGPIEAQSCRGAVIRGSGQARAGANARLRGNRQYLRMRRALLDANQYTIPDIPTWDGGGTGDTAGNGDADRKGKKAGRKRKNADAAAD